MRAAVLFLFGTSLLLAQAVDQSTQGSCSPAVYTEGNVTIECHGVSDEEFKRLQKSVLILNAVLQQGDAQIMSKLDEILTFLAPIKKQVDRQAPRVLGELHEKRLVRLLSPHAGQRLRLIVHEGFSEAVDFGKELEVAFTEAGWIVEVVQMFGPVGDGPFRGLNLGVRNHRSPPATAKVLLDAMSSIGHPLRAVFDANIPQENLILWVGEKVASR